MKTLGTIFASEADLRRFDRHADKMEEKRLGIQEAALGHLPRRDYYGETRFYESPERYAIVSLHHRVLWFELRADGWHGITRS